MKKEIFSTIDGNFRVLKKTHFEQFYNFGGRIFKFCVMKKER